MKRICLFTTFMLLTFFSSYAQGPGFPGDGDVEDVPIDGGASALVIGAAAYGARKLKKRREQQKNAQ